MQTTAIGSSNRISTDFNTRVVNGRPDFEFAAALQKVSPQQQARAKSTATDFEAMFLNSMFSQMTSGLKGEGPFGETQGTGVWRSMLTEQYSRNFARAGGVGIATEVYRTLIVQQAKRAGQGNSQGNSQGEQLRGP
jgi:Rod binding domain-containing protein